MPWGCTPHWVAWHSVAQHCINQPAALCLHLWLKWQGHGLAAHVGLPAELVPALTNDGPGFLLPNPCVDASLQPLHGVHGSIAHPGSPLCRAEGHHCSLLVLRANEAHPEHQ